MVQCVGEGCGDICGGETGMRVLGIRANECGIILKWKERKWVNLLDLCGLR
jgi:hypothetical protein